MDNMAPQPHWEALRGPETPNGWWPLHADKWGIHHEERPTGSRYPAILGARPDHRTQGSGCVAIRTLSERGPGELAVAQLSLPSQGILRLGRVKGGDSWQIGKVWGPF